MSVRVRMAPSPTGEYHIGHIRTVLYNYAFARKHGGKFIIRMEDTDRARYVEGSPDRILDVITDYALSWDEGPRVGGDFGPYVQSERLAIYEKYALELVEKEKAYYCFCTKERLTELRASQQAQGVPTTKYDKHCLTLSPEEVKERLARSEPYVIRLNVPADALIAFEDCVYGKISIPSSDIDDQVLLKSDGFPTYHLGVVVDDHLMEITHVLRGNDWLPSTPKHILLYKAFDWQPPVYIHLPNLKEMGGAKKLSKRFGSVYAVEFLKEGYLPEALLNFLMFLGWNPGTDKEIYSLDEFITDFSIERVHKTDLVAFDRKKLAWFNGYYIRQLSLEALLGKITFWAAKFNKSLSLLKVEKSYAYAVLKLVQDRLVTFDDIEVLTEYFFAAPGIDKELLIRQSGSAEKARAILERFCGLYNEVAPKDWEISSLDRISHELVVREKLNIKEAFMTLRVAVTGETATPPLFDILAFMGKDEVLRRLTLAL